MVDFSSIVSQLAKSGKILAQVQTKLEAVAVQAKGQALAMLPQSATQLKEGVDVLTAGKAMVTAVVNDVATDHSISALAKTTANFDSNWDVFAKEVEEVFNATSLQGQGKVLETFAKTEFGDNVFYAGSAVKNQLPNVLGGISDFQAAVDGFGGSYHDPVAAAKKIKNGVDSMVKATEKVAKSVNDMVKTYKGQGQSAQGLPLLEKISNLHDTALLKAVNTAMSIGSGVVSVGASGSSVVQSLKDGDYMKAAMEAKQTIDKTKSLFSSVTAEIVKNGKLMSQLQSKLHPLTNLTQSQGFDIVKRSFNSLTEGVDVWTSGKALVTALVNDVAAGHSVGALAKLTADFDSKWDTFAKEVEDVFKAISPTGQDKVLETFVKSHLGDSVFYAGSALKNELPNVLGGISDFQNAVKGFGGSYRNPLEAAAKIKNGVESIVKATERVANSLNQMVKIYKGKGQPAQGLPLLDKIGNLHDTKLMKSVETAMRIGGGGVAVVAGGANVIQDLKNGNYMKAAADAKQTLDNFKSLTKDGMGGDKAAGAAQATGKQGQSCPNTAKSQQGQNGIQQNPQNNDDDDDDDDDWDDDDDNDSGGEGGGNSYVCSGARLKCTFGTSQSSLMVYPDRTVFLTGKPMANISDHKSMENIMPFGKCRTVSYPPTGAATAARHGHLTPMPCVPGTYSPWMKGKTDYIVKGSPALLKTSICQCCYGGIITLINDGQTPTGPADMSKKGKEKFEMGQNKNQISTDSVLDGIQLALDAAGFIPGFGAIPDLTNAAISALRGNWAEAGLSVLAAVPIIGDVAAGAKIASKGLKVAKNVNKVRKVTLAKDAKKFISKEITKKDLLKSGICHSEKEVEFFQKSLRKERKDFAYNFFKKKGETNKKVITGWINGIDLNHSVKIRKISPGEELIRFNEPGKVGGEFFGISTRTAGKINVPRNYGLQPVVVKNGKVIRRKKTVYKVEQPFECFESTAAPIKAPLDGNWGSKKTGKMSNNWKDTKGGARQIWVPKKFQKFQGDEKIINPVHVQP